MKINDVRKIFGERIQLLRKEQNMTIAELSQASGLSADSLKKLEDGLCESGATELCALADVFGVPCDFLNGMTDERIPFPRRDDDQPIAESVVPG